MQSFVKATRRGHHSAQCYTTSAGLYQWKNKSLSPISYPDTDTKGISLLLPSRRRRISSPLLPIFESRFIPLISGICDQFVWFPLLLRSLYISHCLRAFRCNFVVIPVCQNGLILNAILLTLWFWITWAFLHEIWIYQLIQFILDVFYSFPNISSAGQQLNSALDSLACIGNQVWKGQSRI